MSLNPGDLDLKFRLCFHHVNAITGEQGDVGFQIDTIGLDWDKNQPWCFWSRRPTVIARRR